MGYLLIIPLLTSIEQTIINYLNLIIMKKLFFFIAFLFVTTFSFAQDVYVQGYTSGNGTYAQGYYRTSPNYTRNDNYSTVGNMNPYTGTAGTHPRDRNTTTASYSVPIYSNTYTNSTYSSPTTTYSSASYNSSNTIYTGSRGGQYYINSNGNKSYISR